MGLLQVLGGGGERRTCTVGRTHFPVTLGNPVPSLGCFLSRPGERLDGVDASYPHPLRSVPSSRTYAEPFKTKQSREACWRQRWGVWSCGLLPGTLGLPGAQASPGSGELPEPLPGLACCPLGDVTPDGVEGGVRCSQLCANPTPRLSGDLWRPQGHAVLRQGRSEDYRAHVIAKHILGKWRGKAKQTDTYSLPTALM